MHDQGTGGPAWRIPLTYQGLVVERTSRCNAKCAMCYQAMSRRRSNMGLAGEQSSECLGGREIAQSAAGSIVDLLGDGGEVGLVIGDHRALGQILPVEPVVESPIVV